MANVTDPPDNESVLDENERAYLAYGEQLRAAVAASIEGWLRIQLQRFPGLNVDALAPDIANVANEADRRLVELIEADVDTPLSGPLERIRGAVELLGPTLRDHGVTPPTRDPFDVRVRPDDHYALGPISFADLGEPVHQAGIAWGAAKAYLHKAKRK